MDSIRKTTRPDDQRGSERTKGRQTLKFGPIPIPTNKAADLDNKAGLFYTTSPDLATDDANYSTFRNAFASLMLGQNQQLLAPAAAPTQLFHDCAVRVLRRRQHSSLPSDLR